MSAGAISSAPNVMQPFSFICTTGPSLCGPSLNFYLVQIIVNKQNYITRSIDINFFFRYELFYEKEKKNELRCTILMLHVGLLEMKMK